MKRIISSAVLLCALAFVEAPAFLWFSQPVEKLAGKKIVFLGDSITQGGGYISFASYYLNRLYPRKNFDIYPLGLSSETLSGLSETNHAGGKFPRPCLFERLGRLLERTKPDVVFACYGINDGIYQPLDDGRFTAFKNGVNKLIAQCQAAGVKNILLITPPIYDATTPPGGFNYDGVMTAYAAWELTLKMPGVQVIDLHTAMRKARDARTEVFSRGPHSSRRRRAPADGADDPGCARRAGAGGAARDHPGRSVVQAGGCAAPSPFHPLDATHRLHARKNRHATTARRHRGRVGDTPGEDGRTPKAKMMRPGCFVPEVFQGLAARLSCSQGPAGSGNRHFPQASEGFMVSCFP